MQDAHSIVIMTDLIATDLKEIYHLKCGLGIGIGIQALHILVLDIDEPLCRKSHNDRPLV